MGPEPGWNPPKELWRVFGDVFGCSTRKLGGDSPVSEEEWKVWGESVVSVLLGTLQESHGESWGLWGLSGIRQ